MFADVRGSTALAEELGSARFASLLNRFYRAAADVLVPMNAIIDKMVGDEVMAFFIPAFGAEYRKQAARAAQDIAQAVGYGSGRKPWLRLGIGVHAGPAYVGKVGAGEVSDFTALGDTVNTAARLQSEAGPGEIVLSEAVLQDGAPDLPPTEPKVLSLRGKEEQVPVRVLRLAEDRGD